MSETNVENEPGYCDPPPPVWLEKLAIIAGALTLLLLGGMAMIGAAFILVLSGYGA